MIDSPVTLFQALADETRLRCLALLATEGELCVCELTHALRASQPKISRHLAALREMGIVADRRAGVWVHYRLHPKLPAWARRALTEAAAAARASRRFDADRKALRQMPNRPATRCAV